MQRLLQGGGLFLHGGLIQLRVAALLADFHQLRVQLGHGFLQLNPGLGGLLHALPVGGKIRLGRLVPGGFPGHGNFLLMQFVQRVAALLLQAVLLCLTFRQLLPEGVQANLPRPEGLGQFLQLPLPAQQAHCPRRGGAAGHGAAGVHHVALQRHQAEGMVARTHDGNAHVQVFRDDRAAQQVLHDAAILRRAVDQIRRHADAPGQPQSLPLPVIQQLAAHGGHGQEGGPAQTIAAQVLNQLLGGMLIVGDDVLLRRAQGHVDGGFIRPGHGNQPGQHAPDGLHAPVPGELHRLADGVVVALHVPGHFDEQLLPALGRLQLGGEGFGLGADAHERGVLAVQFLRPVPVRFGKVSLTLLFLRQFGGGFPDGPVQPLLRLLHFLPGHGKIIEPFLHLPAHGFQTGLIVAHGREAIHGGHDGGLVGFKGLVRFGFPGRGLLCVPAGLVQRLLGGVQQFLLGIPLALRPLEQRVQLLQTAGSVLLLFLDTGAVLLPGVPAALQGGEGVGGLMDGLGTGHQTVAGAGDLFLQLGDVRLLVVPLLSFVLQSGLGSVQHGAEVHQLRVQLGQTFLGFVGADKKQVQVQHLQLCGQLDIDPGVPGLLLEGAQLPGEFFQNIVNAGGVFQRPLQLLVSFFLPGLELDDAGGFLKDLTAILAAAGENLVDTALADDGVALLADAGIAEEVDDVLEAAGGAVEVVFALAVAVDPAGDHDLGEIHGQGAILIVEHEADLAVGQGLALLGAVEDHVGHAGAAQGLGGLLAQHPAHRVADVALARAVGPDNARDSLAEDDLRPLRKGLEAVQFQFLEPHGVPPSVWAALHAAVLLIIS